MIPDDHGYAAPCEQREERKEIGELAVSVRVNCSDAAAVSQHPPAATDHHRDACPQLASGEAIGDHDMLGDEVLGSEAFDEWASRRSHHHRSQRSRQCTEECKEAHLRAAEDGAGAEEHDRVPVGLA